MTQEESLPKLIFLIGYRGTGKSTVARLLAEKLGWQAIDADEILELRYGKSIRSIFADEGEAGFRVKEATILAEICQQSKQVIATGGGCVLRSDNRAKMKAAGFVVWLTADAQTLWNRLQADASSCERRPPLTTGGLAEIVELLQAREPYYADCASMVVDTVGRSAEEIAAAIMERLSSV
jgi:shikimate kinase